MVAAELVLQIHNNKKNNYLYSRLLLYKMCIQVNKNTSVIPLVTWIKLS